MLSLRGAIKCISCDRLAKADHVTVAYLEGLANLGTGYVIDAETPELKQTAVGPFDQPR